VFQAHRGHSLPVELRDAIWLPPLGDGLCHNLGLQSIDGDVSLTVGTSGAVRVLLDYDAQPIPDGLWRYRCDERTMAVGGAITSAGNALEWVQRFSGNEIDWSFVESDKPDLTSLTAVTDVYGRRGPDYPADAAGSVTGLRPHHTLMDLVQAFAVDSWHLYAYLFDCLEELVEPRAISAAGGVTDHDHRTVQLLADAIARPVTVTSCPQPSMRGAALYAATYLNDSAVSLDLVVENIRAGKFASPAAVHTFHPREHWTSALHHRWKTPARFTAKDESES
jgi:gluconokinase